MMKHLSLTAILLATVACHHRSGAELDARASVPGLDQLRAATEPFAVLDAAVAAGYARDVPNCLVHEHHGAMGYHHANPQFMDATVDVTRPEILLYERFVSGEYRLNGVEFIVPYRSWPRDSTPPTVMGQTMLQEDNLNFWYRHVWVWKANPDGLFANFHPGISCSAESRKVFKPSGS
jgi:hypothetical protein